MCIMCKCGYDGESFMINWSQAIKYLKLAEKDMLKCSKKSKHYDVIHKKIVKMRKELSIIEQTREII